MQTNLRVSNANAIELTLTVTMSLGEWKKLNGQLDVGEYPACSIESKIREMDSLAEKNFFPAPDGPTH